MRTVFSNRECIHVWASQSQSHGKGASVFFDGPDVYSYGRHFRMARMVTNERGECAVLVNPSSYSVTTSKHQGYVRDAVSHMWTFRAPNAERDDAAVLAYYVEKADMLWRKAQRARANADWRINAARECVDEFNAYAHFFGISERMQMPADASELIAAADARQAEAERQADARAAKVRAEAAEAIAAWQRGEDVYLPYLPGPALLRVKDDSIETSQGASVPLAVAPALWSRISAARARGLAYAFAGLGESVGRYELRRIESNGDVEIGCHRIEYAELARLAGLLGLDVPASIAA